MWKSIFTTHIRPPINFLDSAACRAICAQEYSTGYAQDLDEIRAHWMAIAQRREALTVRDAHAMLCLTCLRLGPRQRSPARGLLPSPFSLTITWFSILFTAGAFLQRGKDGPQAGA
jgi:hypothetical protein